MGGFFIVGLDIEVKNERNSFLKKIFASIDLSIYDWEILRDEAHHIENDQEISGLFEALQGNFTDGPSFIDAISRECYYLIFAEYKAYLPNARRMRTGRYEDFADSECSMAVSCFDVCYIEVYCKDIDILSKIYANCKAMDVVSVTYVSAEQAKGRVVIDSDRYYSLD